MEVLLTSVDGSAFSDLFLSRLSDPINMLINLLWSGPGYQSPHITVLRAWAGLRNAELRGAKLLTSREKVREGSGRSGFCGFSPEHLALAGQDHLSLRTGSLYPALYLG